MALWVKSSLGDDVRQASCLHQEADYLLVRVDILNRYLNWRDMEIKRACQSIKNVGFYVGEVM